MVDEFALAKQIITTGIHHTGVEGTITKSGKPLIGTKLSILGTDKQTQTDKIQKGISEKNIKGTWKPELAKFKVIRKKYLLYPDFN